MHGQPIHKTNLPPRDSESDAGNSRTDRCISDIKKDMQATVKINLLLIFKTN